MACCCQPGAGPMNPHRPACLALHFQPRRAALALAGVALVAGCASTPPAPDAGTLINRAEQALGGAAASTLSVTARGCRSPLRLAARGCRSRRAAVGGPGSGQDIADSPEPRLILGGHSNADPERGVGENTSASVLRGSGAARRPAARDPRRAPNRSCPLDRPPHERDTIELHLRARARHGSRASRPLRA